MNSKQSKQTDEFVLTQAIMDKHDPLIESPSAKASRVYALIKASHPELTIYDMTCFCIEWLGSQVVTGNLAFMAPEIKSLASLLYYAHYYPLECPDSATELRKMESTTNGGPSQTSETDSLKTESSEQ